MGAPKTKKPEIRKKPETRKKHEKTRNPKETRKNPIYKTQQAPETRRVQVPNFTRRFRCQIQPNYIFSRVRFSVNPTWTRPVAIPSRLVRGARGTECRGRGSCVGRYGPLVPLDCWVYVMLYMYRSITWTSQTVRSSQAIVRARTPARDRPEPPALEPPRAPAPPCKWVSAPRLPCLAILQKNDPAQWKMTEH
jgi:hypothetical protein